MNHYPFAIVITGATATGKTSLAFEVASQFKITDIVSCDSRQIYKYLNIVTGKDIPSGFKFKHVSTFQNFNIGYYQGFLNNHTLRLWGFDFALPDRHFSVFDYFRIFHQHILPELQNKFIIVGGTGYFLNSLFTPKETFYVPTNPDLRIELSQHSILILQNKLESIDFPKYSSMNNSDKNNPRRLIRAIEVATSDNYLNPNRIIQNSISPLWIGLKHSDLVSLEAAINQRVLDRFHHPFIKKEIEFIYQNNWQDSIPAQTLGYPQLFQYFGDLISETQAITDWTTAEKQYARRQITWFKKQEHINWFDWNSTLEIFKTIQSHIPNNEQ